MLTAKDLADRLNGRQYLSEMNRQDHFDAHTAGLVVVFGGSDDIAEFSGAINDEASGPGEILIDAEGVLPSWDSASESQESAADYLRRAATAKKIEAVWCAKGQPYDWTYKTSIPHSRFEVLDGPDLYCMGIVFSLKDLGQ